MNEVTWPNFICRIRPQRFTNKRRNWRLLDVCIGLAGNIAVSGYAFRTNRTFIDIFSSPQKKFGIGTKPPLLYSREFVAVRGYSWRYVCFLEEPNKIVTGVDNTLDVIATDENKVLRSYEVNDIIRCVSVSEKNIFIGSLSGAVYVFDKVLNFLETIRLEGLQNVVIEDVLQDMEVVPGRFFVCTHKCMPLWDKNRKALAFRGTNGKELHTFTTQDARGVAASLEYGILCVLFSNRLAVFSLSGYHCIFVVDMDSCADKVSISNRGIMVTGEQETGEVKIYDIKALFTYDYLKQDIAFLLQGSDVTKLLTHFDVSEAKTNYITQSNSPKEALLQVLEDECIIESSNVERLKEAFKQLKLKSCFYAVQIYQKTRDSSTSYERFLTKFSSHLSGSVLTRLCKYFKVSDDLKKGILGSQNPGYSLLLNLSDREVITESNVTSLEEPMGNFGLAEAVADIRKYQLTVEELKRELQSDADLVVPGACSSPRAGYGNLYPALWRLPFMFHFDDEEEEFTFSPYSSSSLIHQRDAERWKQDPDILPSLPTTSCTQQERPSFLQNMKKWLGFDQPELRGAAGDDSSLTSELDDDEISNVHIYFSDVGVNANGRNKEFLKNDEESVRSEKPESAYIKRRPTFIVPESKSSGKGASSSVRQSMRNQTGEIFENVAQEEGNSTDTVFLQDVYPFQKRAKWTKGAKGDPTGSLEGDTLDATRGPQSVEMETIRKSDNIVEETKTPLTETEIQENLEDLEKVTQVGFR
ncbi:hypothetical protein HOLleu_35878 [Holothuria leucospilota]|uniref:Uncharacterized protein n=1 Tax=Holothuria leucospilota TaxID=206669 RepID=A0A9Q1BG64_HOLLE|nr:hypothetical protein HOLleu_35878 [Holothuria leucospilota]